MIALSEEGRNSGTLTTTINNTNHSITVINVINDITTYMFACVYLRGLVVVCHDRTLRGRQELGYVGRAAVDWDRADLQAAEHLADTTTHTRLHVKTCFGSRHCLS